MVTPVPYSAVPAEQPPFWPKAQRFSSSLRSQGDAENQARERHMPHHCPLFQMDGKDLGGRTCASTSHHHVSGVLPAMPHITYVPSLPKVPPILTRCISPPYLTHTHTHLDRMKHKLISSPQADGHTNKVSLMLISHKAAYY